MRRALVSVYDKTGLVPFVERLVAAGFQVVSSGGTATTLGEAGVEVTTVEKITGAPEILGGRVKTLHPRIHGGILARGDQDQDELDANSIEPFELVVCNLYPFRETVADPAAGADDIIEKIDIGGPAMIRAAAKNHHHVGVVVSPEQYDEVAKAIESGGLDSEFRRHLAAEAFYHTAAYDAAIVGWLGRDMVIPLRHAGSLRYGENPHQEAGLYREEGVPSWWAGADLVQGKEMSFNNYVDAESAWRLAADLGEGSVVVVKHTNPAGAARADSLAEAFQLAWDGDPLAAFGGVIGINGEIDDEVAAALSERFVEVVIGRGSSESARSYLAEKKNLRVLLAPAPHGDDVDLRRIEGGLLVQRRDVLDLDGWDVVSERRPDDGELESLRFAWVVCAHTKSNAVVIGRGKSVVGVGAGDQSRVGAAERAVVKAGERAQGAVAASDAFLPFRDGLDALAAAGVTALAEPGGSRNDDEVIAAADEHGMALVFTGRRHFRH
jgi:phosphoribosylaminoimidazolecarboxamide formyltransferase / IMP cyclohydrolase